MVHQKNLFHIGEVEDFVEEQYGPVTKRSRFASAPITQVSFANNGFQVPPPVYNPLDEPSPLGLKLRKSPSLLELIQMALSTGSKGKVTDSENKVESKGKAASTEPEKVKASNFPALSLKIGSWEYVSKYEGDLVAKCYFAKHKLVWEVLEDHLKSKIEIQWSDIAAMKAEFPETGSGTLTIVMSRQPAFFRETNPQPRKHTLWQATSDFTDGEASKNRVHYLQCSPGVMNKHYEKLIQCDPRLGALSQHPNIIMESPFFESQASVIKIPDDSKSDGCMHVSSTDRGSPCSIFDDVASSASSFTSGHTPLADHAPSPSSVMDTLDEQYSEVPKSYKGFNAQGINQSMSMTDLVNHYGHCITEKIMSGSILSKKASECQVMLEGINQALLSDNEPTIMDEQSLMKKVFSLGCLLQEADEASNAQVDGENRHESVAGRGKNVSFDLMNNSIHENGNGDIMPFAEQAPVFPRNDSLGDLLLDLPRIASFPKFLWGIAERDEFQPFN